MACGALPILPKDFTQPAVMYSLLYISGVAPSFAPTFIPSASQ